MIVDTSVADVVVGDNEEESCEEVEEEVDGRSEGIVSESDDYDDVINTSTSAQRRV